MKRYLISFAAIVVILFLIVSCYYDNTEALYPSLNSSCDTANVTYSGTIAPILSNNCLSCHRSAATGGSILLTNYAQVVASASRITGAIKQLPFYFAMPKNGSKLKACSIAQWDIWVRNGMPDN